MTKAIFFDIDGTLLSFQTHTMSPAILEALHKLQEKGVKLFLSTGRHKSMIQSVLDLFPFDGCITSTASIASAETPYCARFPWTKATWSSWWS